MPAEKRVRSAQYDHATQQDSTAAEADEPDSDEPDTEEALEDESYEIFRVSCPDCGQPIALLADEDRLPEHALCATRWNPFGPVVCEGSRRAADEADALDGVTGAQEHGLAALLTLPEGLDWRTQPFSHVGGPGAQPTKKSVPPQRPARQRKSAARHP